MAITATNLTAGQTTTNLSAYTTASISPTANRLILAAVAVQDSADSGAPTLSGNGLSWVQIASLVYSTTGQGSRLTLFRAMGASPSAGVVTITCSSASTGCSWVIDEIDGVNTGGTNGSAAVVQSATNSATATTSPLTVTLSAFGDAANRAYGAFADTRSDANELTAGTSFTRLALATHTSPQNCVATEWRSDAADTSVDMNPSGAASVDIAGIAIEIADSGFSGGGGGGSSDIIIIVMD